MKTLREAREQYVVSPTGRKTAVILSIEEYERLLEDLHDLGVVAERRDEDPISLDDMKTRLTLQYVRHRRDAYQAR